ncbi:MAG TPA: lysophospholipid acyltransferase family protein [Solirubrobacteraceae bacterium]|nr:lysophospholipid acyltransferase family protein [Solirubrobacteraceae bacterium]
MPPKVRHEDVQIRDQDRGRPKGATPGPPQMPPPPQAGQLDRIVSVLEPLRRLLQPTLYGAERIPDRGVLFVGNHTLYGLIDVPFMLAELWRREVLVRPLGEHTHYAIPVWRNLLEMCGMVRGTRDNVRVLMRDGQNVLVFPGGAGEVFKQRSERYKLKWKERLGFARLAIEFGYPIVPFAAVGVEEMFAFVADDSTPGFAAASHLLQRLVGLPLPPLGVGLAPLLPRPERLYFWIGEPIPTDQFAGMADDDAAPREVRRSTHEAIMGGVDFLLAERDADPRRNVAARLLHGGGDAQQAARDPQAQFVLQALDAWNHSGPASIAAWLSNWVILEDPPSQPGATRWLGRDATLHRLDEITTSLGGRWVHIVAARSIGEEVLVAMDLRSARAHEGTHIASYHLLFEVQYGEITRIRVFDAQDSAERAARDA